MPIWIKYGNVLALCDRFSYGELNFYAYSASVNIAVPIIAVSNLTEQQAKGLMREISEVVASGGTYYEIAERSKL